MMPISSRTLNILLGAIDVVIVIAIIYTFMSIKTVEKSKIYFTNADIVNNRWTQMNPDVEFTVTSSKISLIIDEEEIIKDASFELNEHTGEIQYNYNGKHSKELYLRDASKTDIVIWYNKNEYHLKKNNKY